MPGECEHPCCFRAIRTATSKRSHPVQQTSLARPGILSATWTGGPGALGATSSCASLMRLTITNALSIHDIQHVGLFMIFSMLGVVGRERKHWFLCTICGDRRKPHVENVGTSSSRIYVISLCKRCIVKLDASTKLGRVTIILSARNTVSPSD